MNLQQEVSFQEMSFQQRASLFEAHASSALAEAKAKQFAAGLPWVSREECCQKENWLIKEYADGKKLLVEILSGGKENIIREL